MLWSDVEHPYQADRHVYPLFSCPGTVRLRRFLERRVNNSGREPRRRRDRADLIWIQNVGTIGLIWILPVNNEALGTVQNFNVFVTEAPVDAEAVVSEGVVRRRHIAAMQK